MFSRVYPPPHSLNPIMLNNPILNKPNLMIFSKLSLMIFNKINPIGFSKTSQVFSKVYPPPHKLGPTLFNTLLLSKPNPIFNKVSPISNKVNPTSIKTNPLVLRPNPILIKANLLFNNINPIFSKEIPISLWMALLLFQIQIYHLFKCSPIFGPTNMYWNFICIFYKPQ